ncbi:MAG: hypothetical protein HY015_08340 [Bacteroidetes bacterium]|nr:hypothetical protein [Bacteroidota bacterium]MBI3482965.1 hypothetical protein [Bacteroidota bacterium]
MIPPREEQQIISYLTLRVLIGAAGIALPVLCPIVTYILSGYFFMPSISDYYYSPARNIFEGILFVLAFFLLAYRGYDTRDSIIANFGFAFALGVALLPCQSSYSAIHFISAGLLFGVFIWFSLVQFTKHKGDVKSESKVTRNRVYVICGWVMVASIVGIALSEIAMSETMRAQNHVVFWCESIALWAFGCSWLVKGEVLWKDEVVEKDVM